MPEPSSDNKPSESVVFERASRPTDALSPAPRPHPNAMVPLINDAVRVWLSSEFVSPTEYFRFDPPVAVYESGGWPLGVQLGNTPDERIAMSAMRDGYFDWDVACALKLPWRYAGLRFRPPHRREDVNLWIRHVGRWDGEPHRLAEIVAGLARLPKGRPPGYKYHALYALTPFSIIGQTWCERDPSEPAFVLDTTIAFFYTFETLIQECFIADARRAGASSADIIASYEHRYANTRAQPNLMLRDPTKLKLARYANPSIDWDSIRAVLGNDTGGSTRPGWEARSRREFLFISRLQTHLMVAIAVACQGLANFASGRVRSALVSTCDKSPQVEALAPHWLGHMIGSYDHAAECADMLQSLARHYGQSLSENLRGVPIPPTHVPKDPFEWRIKATSDSLSGCTIVDPIDAYRWNLFDASLDDASVVDWSRDAIERVDWAATPRKDQGWSRRSD
jgi:hypothetical protein